MKIEEIQVNKIYNLKTKLHSRSLSVDYEHSQELIVRCFSTSITDGLVQCHLVGGCVQPVLITCSPKDLFVI